ncbi:MAG: restriction endonuclease subunit S [Flavobacteriales bacterium]|nr:restriction endonuclease subunit S [Flavobacteriales bacterium]
MDEIAEVIDCEHKTAPRVEQSAFYSVRTPDILNGRIDYANCYRVDEPTYELWTRRGKPEAGDIILAREAPVGEVGLIQPGYNVCLGQRTVLIKVNREVADSSYLTFHLCAPPIKTELKEQSGGSVVSHLNMKDIRAFRLSLPDLPEQRAIASVLSSLDAKIDLLHRQNKTLEAMAETLFRQWFVEEAEEGLTQRPLSSVANYLNGVACQKYPAKDPVNRLPVLKIKDLRDGLSESSDWATTDIDPKYYVEAGDVIFSWSASLIVKLWDGPKAILNQHLFKVTSDEFPKWFYFMWTKHYVDEFVSIAESHATTFGHIKRGDLDEAMVLVPSPDRLIEMTLVMEPLFDKHMTNSAQIKSLTALRDTLLPKLMSGEVRVESVTDSKAWPLG